MADAERSISHFLEWRASMSEEDFLARLSYPVLVECQPAEQADEDAFRYTTTELRREQLEGTAGPANRISRRARVFPIVRDEDSVFSGMINVGRATNNDVVLPQAEVSKFHAYFQCVAKDRYVLVDAGSMNGTYVNGTALQPGDKAELRDGDLVSFSSAFVFIYCTAPEFFRLLGCLSGAG